MPLRDARQLDFNACETFGNARLFHGGLLLHFDADRDKWFCRVLY